MIDTIRLILSVAKVGRPLCTPSIILNTSQSCLTLHHILFPLSTRLDGEGGWGARLCNISDTLKQKFPRRKYSTSKSKGPEIELTITPKVQYNDTCIILGPQCSCFAYKHIRYTFRTLRWNFPTFSSCALTISSLPVIREVRDQIHVSNVREINKEAYSFNLPSKNAWH